MLVDAATNTWSYTSLVYVPGIANVWAAGTKSLSAALDRLSITTVGGTDTFGQITSTRAPREVQLSLKLYW